MNWETALLGDICSPKQWKTLSRKDLLPSGYPVYGANGRIGYTDKVTHFKPVILVGCRGSCGTVHVTPSQVYANGNAMALDSLNESKADISFVEKFLRFRGFKDVISGSSQPQIIRRNIVRIEIPLPPLEEQKRIAAILDAADDLRIKRKQALEELGNLLQSAFLDLFGDPVTNPKGWGEVLFNELSNGSFRNGLSPSKRGKIDGEVLTLTAITKGNFEMRHRKEASFDREPNTNQLVRSDTFLICRGNGNKDLVGIGCFPQDDLPSVAFPDTMIGVNIDTKTINPDYLQNIWNNTGVRKQIEAGARTTNGTFKVNQGVLGRISIPIPPISLQNRFGEIARKDKNQQSIMKSQLIELDTLFAALQQRAFNGEL